MPRINIVGWRKGIHTISIVKLLRDQFSIGLKEAKGYVDDVLVGKVIPFTMESATEPESLRLALDELGAIVEIESD